MEGGPVAILAYPGGHGIQRFLAIIAINACGNKAICFVNEGSKPALCCHDFCKLLLVHGLWVLVPVASGWHAWDLNDCAREGQILNSDLCEGLWCQAAEPVTPTTHVGRSDHACVAAREAHHPLQDWWRARCCSADGSGPSELEAIKDDDRGRNCRWIRVILLYRLDR